MVYTVYKTTNLVSSRYYFGVHKTRNPNDSYLGSGVYIRRAVKKHGAEHFRKEILFIYLDPESAFGKEKELVSYFRAHDPLCMNLEDGGVGGWGYVNSSGMMLGNKFCVGRKLSEETKKKIGEKMKDFVAPPELCQLRSENVKGEKNPFFGRHHSTSAREKIARAQRLRAARKRAVCGL